MTEEELLQSGISAAKAGETKKAAALLAQVVQADPASEEGWFWLGIACQSRNSAVIVSSAFWLSTPQMRKLANC